MARNFSTYITLLIVFLAISSVVYYVFAPRSSTLGISGEELSYVPDLFTSQKSTSEIAAAASTQSGSDVPANNELVVQKSGTPITPAVISTPGQPPAGYVPYRNEKYGFSYYHSKDAKIKEYDEGGGAMTLVHENFEKVRGFQVFIVPYSGTTISEERFRLDVPSGIRKDVENTTLDGVRAVTFKSHNLTMGETREIWVIHDGYLYEITTFTGVGQWFTPIIQSWRFNRS